LFPKKALSGARSRAGALALLLIAVPVCALAQDYTLRPDLSASHEWDDNVFALENGERSSWVSRVSPGLALVRKDERGRISLEGELTSRTYWSFHDIDAVDKRVILSATRRITPRLTLDARARLSFLESRDVLFEDEAQQVDVLAAERPDLDRQLYELEARYQLSPRTSLIPSFKFEDRDYDDNKIVNSDLEDSQLTTLGLALDHVLTPLDRLQLSFRHEDEAEEPSSSTSTRLDRDNQLESVVLTWVRMWSPKWSSNLSIGHRWIQEELKDFPTLALRCSMFVVIPGGLVCTEYEEAGDAFTTDESNRTTGTVGSVRLTRALSRGELQFGYTRDARSAGAGTTGGTVETDSYFAIWTHSLNSRMKLTLSGSWSDYESTSQFDQNIVVLNAPCPPAFEGIGNLGPGVGCTRELPSELDLDQLLLQARLDWRIRKHLNAFVRFSYFDRDSDGLRLNSQTRRRVMAGFRYHFDQDL
jgi:hypothetical protein